MTLAILGAIVAVATLLLVFRWRRTGSALYGLALVLFLATGCGVLPQWLLGNLQASYIGKTPIEWKARNAIVMLGLTTERIAGGTIVEPGTFSYARLVKTVELYNDCRKTGTICEVIVSGGDARNHGSPEASVYQDALIRLGVNAADILVEPNSMNTWQNAEFTGPILKRLDAQRVLLVTSGVHLRRGELYFDHFDIPTTPVRVDYLAAMPSVIPLAYNFAVTDIALHETIGIARYRIYNALGWNPTRTLPRQA
jgi:uncharacterized SAM-binding protein YcdF (DUF218 family)